MTFNIPDNLKNAIENDSLILFVGAGLSKPLGLPNWNELILSLIRAVSKEKPEMASAEALFTSGIMDTFKTLALLESYKGVVFDELEQILDKQVDYSSADLTLQKQLWKVSSQIFTANYDRAIEIAGGHDKDVFVYDNANKIRKINSLKNYVFKIHGDIKDSADCILFESQYNKLYTDSNGAIFELKSALAHKTVLFIGFSMNDPYVKGIVEFIHKMFNGLGNKHYLIRTDNESFIDKGIETIDIKSWTNLSEFLKSLIKIKAEESNSTVSKLEQESSSSITITSPTNRLNDYPKPDPLFTGREDEIQRFKNALYSHTVFAVEGLGGTGKTQLVSKCISDFIEDKSKIIWLHGSEESKFDVFVESAGYGEVLKGEKKTQQAIYSGFKDLIERDERIIFLDNYQSVLDKTFADFLTFASPYLAKSRVIFISKEDVNIGDSYVHPIKVTGLKGQSIEYAMKLKKSRTDFEKISDEQLNILCEKTEGHPLAIKLCMPLLARGAKAENIISDIGKYKQLQGVEQLTKRIFNEVYNQCSVEEQKLLKKISVYNNKVSIEAIDYINGSDSFVLVNQLIDKFLLSIDENNFYSLHPLVCELSRQLLEEKVTVHSLAADYFSTKRSDVLVPALEAEIYYHLLNSNQWEKLEKEIEEKGRRYILIGQLGLVKELIDNLQKVGIIKPIFDIFYGDISQTIGLWNDAREFYQKAYTQEYDERVKVEGMIKVGEMLYRLGDIKESFQLFETAHEISKKKLYYKEAARALNNIGLVHELRGNYNDGLDILNRAYVISQKVHDFELIATILNNIGMILTGLGKYAEANESYNSSLHISNISGDKTNTAISLDGIAAISAIQLKYEEALNKCEESLRIRKIIGDKVGIAASIAQIGNILEAQEQYSKALLNLNSALSINEEIGNRHGILSNKLRIASIFVHQKKYSLAISYCNESHDLAKEIGSKEALCGALAGIARVHEEKGQYYEAIEKYYECIRLSEDKGEVRNIAIYNAYIGHIYSNIKIKKYKKAIYHYFISLALRRQMGLPYVQYILNLIKDIKYSKIKENEFNRMAKETYYEVEVKLRSFIPINEICKEELKLKPPTSKSAPCPCGSGKQYKRCHGKAA